ncbi:MAG: hypothetical protein B6226_03500 [Candidatus Cloacimonetes bacterium 4572_65]|nr:MAG: hypothetical protein B6226_03500 [Candidatus Cloacimonetes bacterium 4572_65]
MNISSSQISSISSIKANAVGTVGYYNGKVYKYGQAGAVNLARGKMCIAPAVVANHINLSFQTAPAVGDKVVYVTLGATAATADQYLDGQFVVQDGTGEGRAYPISGNLATDSAGTCKVYLKEPIDTAGALSEANVDLIANPYSGVLVTVADQLDMAVGVPVVAITASYYGWFQTAGPCATLIDETLAIGVAVTIGSSVAGAVEAADGAGEAIVGVVASTGGVDTEYQLINLTIDQGMR